MQDASKLSSLLPDLKTSLSLAVEILGVVALFYPGSMPIAVTLAAVSLIEKIAENESTLTDTFNRTKTAITHDPGKVLLTESSDKGQLIEPGISVSRISTPTLTRK